jgi:Right handed beta helix region
MVYPQVYSSQTGQWTSLFEEAVSIENVGGIDLTNPQDNDILTYNSACANFINEPITAIINTENITPITINASGLSTFNSASVINNANINGNLNVGSSLTVNGVLITGSSPSATVTTEQIQDAAAPLFDHAFHTNITATYDDANNRILLSGSGTTTEEIQDAAAPLLNHAFHNNITATYDDANNRILLSASASSGSVTVTTEEIQDAAAPLLNHAFHNNITATYDDANNRILLSASASSGSVSMSTEDVEDIVGPMFAHANHTNVTASYNDGTGQVLLSVANPSGGSNQTNFYDVVRDYGVVEGEANSATKIQNALNAARDVGGGIVYIPEGTYNVGSTLQIFSGTTLYLTPRTVIFRQFASNPLLVNGANGASYDVYNGQGNIRIIGGIWESRGQAYPIQAAQAIAIGHGDNIIIEDLTISNVGGNHAIEINSSKNVRVKNCKFVGFVNTGNRGFSEAIQIDLAKASLTVPNPYFGWFGAYDETSCQDVIIEGCYFGSSGTAGTTAWPTGIGTHSFTSGEYHKNIKIINNTFENLTEYAIRTYNNYDTLLIQGNIIKNCFAGISVGVDDDADFAEPAGSTMLGYSDNHTSYNVTISNNSIDNSGTTGSNGIWIVNAENVNITNNRIKGLSRSGSNLADGILCVKLINAIISDNNLEDIGDDGIDVRTQSRNVLITNNLTTNVSQTNNNFYRHIYLNDDADNCSIINNRGYRTSANIAAHGLEFTGTCNNLRFFGNYYGSAATTPVDNTSTNSSTSTANA